MITRKEKPDQESVILNSLNPLVKKWFFSRFKEFSLPQKFGVFDIHCRNNILISAPTGATKTLTAFLSILNELVDNAEKGILEDRTYAIYISPLKALNYDIQHNLKTPLEEIEAISGKPLGIRVGVRTGDTTPYERTKMAKTPPHIMITTPESLAIMLQTRSFRSHFSTIEWVVIDEIHALAENKRGVHLSLTMEMLQRLSPGYCRVGLSATIAPLESIAKFLVGTDRDCKIVDVQFLKQLDLKVLSPVPDLINTDYKTLQNKTYELMDSLIQSHKTTLIFTNTRAATERVVHHLKENFPKNYTDVLTVADDDDFEEGIEDPKDKPLTGIGAHHGSLSKSHRHRIEEGLRKGKLKCVVCSTSLELGMDIGYVDLVLLLGSPKSVARALQRIGRSGHQLHSTTKGRIIVLDRDDLIECSVLLKSGIERKIDRIHIPKNCLDVLAQQIYGICIAEKLPVREILDLVKQSYCYKDLTEDDFFEVIKYLAGEYAALEDRHVYGKIWYDPETGMAGKRGRLARVIYMTNIGTIPDQTGVQVKIGTETIGMIDEAFLERLRRGDIFVLGGSTYEFRHSRGTVAQVVSAAGRKPTIPSWFSEMLPLSFDLAWEIGRFRNLMREKFTAKMSKRDILEFINQYLYVDDKAANAIYSYIQQQFDFSVIPTNHEIIIEHYLDDDVKYAVFHTLYGRRVNDCLSRAVAFAISKISKRDVEIGICDNGFYIASKKNLPAARALSLLESKRLDELLHIAIDKTQVLIRRFRHCAGRSLMILRNYKGRKKNVGRQQVSSMILMAAVKRISKDFPILKEARREVLEDLMDLKTSKHILELIEKNRIRVKSIDTTIPSPFAFNMVLMGHLDMIRMEDRIEFLKRMHNLVNAKISLDKGKKGETFDPKLYEEIWTDTPDLKQDPELENLVHQAWNLKRVPMFAKREIVSLLEGKRIGIKKDVLASLHKHKKQIDKNWPQPLIEAVFQAVKEVEEAYS
ncbi:ATP-dependent helicase [Nanoarchaeota archaeon]